MDVSVRINDSQVRSALTKLAERCTNLRPVMTRIGMEYEKRVLDNFRRQQSPDGTPWKPLSSWTIVGGLLRKKGYGKKGDLLARGRKYLANKRILIDSGALQRSVHHQATDTDVTIGSSGSIPYAAIHQFGGMAGRGKKVRIPSRPWLAVNRAGDGLDLTPSDRDRVLKLINEFITGSR